MAFGTPGTRIAGGKFSPHFDEYFVITESEFNEQNCENNKYQAFLKIAAENDIIQKRLGLKNDSNQKRGIRVLPRATNHFTPNKTVTEVIKETKKQHDIGDSGRIPVPTVFVSLSRLFPIGETRLSEKNISKNNEIVKDGVIDKYVEWYNRVLPNSINKDKYSSSNVKKIKKIVNTNGRLHVKLVDSDTKTQSVGEDNLGAIISALVDFYFLKEKQGNAYNGGIICIDEIDASLHPSAQIRLFELLDELSNTLRLQIFITTHSMTLLEKIIKMQNKDNKMYSLVYILDPRIPRIKNNISSIEDIKSDMFDENSYYKPIIKIYCEDEETKFIFEQLIRIINKDKNFNLPEYKIFPMYLGHTQLENLRNFDTYFESVIMLVDGDSRKEQGKNVLNKYLNNDIIGLNSKKLKENTLALPTFLAPESYFYFILSEILNDTVFWQQLERLNLHSNYTSYNLSTILNKVKLDEEGNIQNDKLKEVFCRNTLSRIKNFIDETQALAYYYEKKPEKLERFKSDVKRIFCIVEKKVKANL